MSIIKAKADELYAALKGVAPDRLRLYEDLGATVDPPGVMLGPPRLQWESYCSELTSATFIVIVMAAMDERAMETLWDLVPLVSDAVSAVEDAVVTTASPGVFNANGTDLPSYELTVECSL
jgi:hypothetical protein